MNGKGWSIVAGLVILLAGASYVAGRRAERAELATKARQDALQHNAEQLRLSAKLLAAQHRATVAELARDSIARVRYAEARRKVRVLSDTQVAIVATHDSAGTAVVDSIGSTLTVPKEVIAALTAAETALRQDSVTIAAQSSELTTLRLRDTLHVKREHMLEAQVADLAPASCGAKCGFVAGASVVLAATHPKEVAAAARWIIRLVR